MLRFSSRILGEVDCLPSQSASCLVWVGGNACITSDKFCCLYVRRKRFCNNLSNYFTKRCIATRTLSGDLPKRDRSEPPARFLMIGSALETHGTQSRK